MAEDDDDLNDFKLPPHSNEAADAQLDAKALKLVEDYVASLNRSKNENTIRGDIRTNIVKLGIHSLSFQHELTAQRMMDAADRKDYMAGRRRMGRILADKQEVLFKDDVERIRKRKAKLKEKATKDAAKAATKTAEDIERGDPKRGGAGGANGRGKAKDGPAKKPGNKMSAADRAAATSERNQRLAETQAQSPGAEPGEIQETGDELIARVAREKNAELEQKNGATILDTAIDSMKDGKPKAQSAIAAEIAAAAGTDK